jgi:hypothetical protein
MYSCFFLFSLEKERFKPLFYENSGFFIGMIIALISMKVILFFWRILCIVDSMDMDMDIQASPGDGLLWE